MSKDAFTRALSTPVPQREQAEPNQVKNNAGGYVFQIPAEQRLIRFLVLGIEGGTYYQNEKAYAKQNMTFLKELIVSNETLVWDTVKSVSAEGRAYRQSPTILALAYLFKYGTVKDTPLERKEKTAKALLPIVCRTFTQLTEFKGYAKLLGVNGRALRTAIAEWYLNKDVSQVAYQVVKYRNRNGWTHRDIFRVVHPKGFDPVVGNFIMDKETRSADEANDTEAIIRGYLRAKSATTKQELLTYLGLHTDLPWEALPTNWLKEAEIWKQLFYNGQLKGQALLRNITRLARIGAFNDMVFVRDYANKLTDEQMIRKTRLHPINYLNASIVHTKGQLNRKNNTSWEADRNKDWTSNPIIVDALQEGFHLAFKHIEPANKRTYIAVDTSGSMWWASSVCAGLEMEAATGAAALATVIARSEPYYSVQAFSHEMRSMNITPRMSIDQIEQVMRNNGGGSTNCSLPMLDARKRKIEVDTFIVITDNETWAGQVHPHIALEEYRQSMGRDARLAVVAMTATPFSIANPTDPGMLDVVGFDANGPSIISEFSGRNF